MSNPEIDLDDPKDARIFLRGVRIAGKIIEMVQLADESTLAIEDMTDSQAVHYAKEIFLDFCGGVEGEPGIIELDLEGQNQ